MQVTVVDRLVAGPYKGNVTLATLLSEWRRKQGASLDTAAAKLEVSGATFQRWETGQLIPGDDRIPAIATVLGTPEEKILRLVHQARMARQPPSRGGVQERLGRLEDAVEELSRRFDELLPPGRPPGDR